MKKPGLIVLASACCFAISLVGSNTASGDAKTSLTFSKDIAPILYKNCIGCHRPGEIAPMSLMTYKEVRPWAKAIREKVATREMPPWHLDSQYGKWENDRRMTQKEVDAVVTWIDGGAVLRICRNWIWSPIFPKPRLAACTPASRRSSPCPPRGRSLISTSRCRRTSRKIAISRLSKREPEISRSCITS